MLLLWMERRIAKSADVRPLCPPARIDTDWSLSMSMFTLAGWMHRVCADLAG
jgi:hypothetical protein